MSSRNIVMSAAGVGGETYIEDVFSTYLYTGNGTSQTINNGIDLAGKGGMVWTKSRSQATANTINDTVRGRAYTLNTNATSAQTTSSAGTDFASFNSNGFTVSGTVENYFMDASGQTYASWTFRKAPKFFDVVTYTGNGVAGRAISHSLGVAPGMIFVKCTSNSGNWPVYHRSTGNAAYTILNATFPADTDLNFWYNTTPTASTFTVNDYDSINGSGKTYVAYLFAHDTTTDGLIQCGSWNAGSGTTNITLGWEPQYILFKKESSAGSWFVVDTMRGASETSQSYLKADLSDAESTNPNPPGYPCPTATGFKAGIAAGSFDTFIYMAIRRGPMRTPTDATKVFSVNRESTSASPQTVTTGFPVDLTMNTNTTGQATALLDRLRGGSTTTYKYLETQYTSAESSGSGVGIGFDNNTGIVDNSWLVSTSSIWWNFRRAPGFFDEVCYTGTGSATTQAHNLGVAPELIINKRRNSTLNWYVYAAPLGNDNGIWLNSGNGVVTGVDYWNSTTPTATSFSIGAGNTNISGSTYVNYLFASCPGVSKVGSYTGTGSTQTISCGFTGGARFVLIKRTDSTGDWWVWDTARGMVSGTDPRLALDTTAAETNANWCYTTTGGFQLVTSDASVNANGGSYIFLAIA